MDQRSKLKASLGRFITAMADLMILNLLTILCSLPVITLGPTLCALNTVTLRIARDEPAETLKMFFSAFKANFRKGLILGLIALFGAVVIFADGVYAFSITGAAKIVFCIVTGIVAAVWLTYVSYVFALQAQYENSLISHIRNTYLLAFVNPGKTLLMWVILASPAILFLGLPTNIVAYIGVLFLLFGISLPALGVSAVLKDIFERFNPQDPRGTEDEEES